MHLIAFVCRSEKRGDTERHDDRENRREFLPIVRRKVKMFKQEKKKKDSMLSFCSSIQARNNHLVSKCRNWRRSSKKKKKVLS